MNGPFTPKANKHQAEGKAKSWQYNRVHYASTNTCAGSSLDPGFAEFLGNTDN